MAFAPAIGAVAISPVVETALRIAVDVAVQLALGYLTGGIFAGESESRVSEVTILCCRFAVVVLLCFFCCDFY